MEDTLISELPNLLKSEVGSPLLWRSLQFRKPSSSQIMIIQDFDPEPGTMRKDGRERLETNFVSITCHLRLKGLKVLICSFFF